MKFPAFAIRRWLPDTFAPLSMAMEYGLPLVQVTETVVLPDCRVVASVVPDTLPKLSVAALIVQDAVMVI